MKIEHALIDIIKGSSPGRVVWGIVNELKSDIDWNEAGANGKPLLLQVIDGMVPSIDSIAENELQDEDQIGWVSVFNAAFKDRGNWDENKKNSVFDYFFNESAFKLRFSESNCQIILNTVAELCPGKKFKDNSFQVAVSAMNAPLVRTMISMGVDVNMVARVSNVSHDVMCIDMPIVALARNEEILKILLMAGANCSAKATVFYENNTRKEIDVYEALSMDSKSLDRRRPIRSEDLHILKMFRAEILKSLPANEAYIKRSELLHLIMRYFSQSRELDAVELSEYIKELPINFKDVVDENGLNLVQKIRLQHRKSKADTLISILGITNDERYKLNEHGFSSVHYSLMNGMGYFARGEATPFDEVKRSEIFKEIATVDGFRKFKNEAFRVQNSFTHKGAILSAVNLAEEGYSDQEDAHSDYFKNFINTIRGDKEFSVCLSDFYKVLERIDEETTLDEMVSFIKFAGETHEYWLAENGFSGCKEKILWKSLDGPAIGLRVVFGKILELFNYDEQEVLLNKEYVESAFKVIAEVITKYPELWKIVDEEIINCKSKYFADIFDAPGKKDRWSKLTALAETILLKCAVGVSKINNNVPTIIL